MTDEELFVKFLTQTRLPYVVNGHTYAIGLNVMIDDAWIQNGGSRIEGDSKLVSGYDMFAEFEFNADGSLVDLGVWE